MNKRKSLQLKSSGYEGTKEEFDYNHLHELAETGFEDVEMARDLNVNEKYLAQLRREMLEDY